MSSFQCVLLSHVCFVSKHGRIDRVVFFLRRENSVYRDEHVCLWLFVGEEICTELHVQTSPNFLCMLPMTAARTCSVGVAIRHVLPVVWMTSRFPIMGSMGRRSFCNRSIFLTHRAHSNKPAARCSSGRMGQTDRRTGGRTPYRYIGPAPHSMQTVPINVFTAFSNNLILVYFKSADGFICRVLCENNRVSWISKLACLLQRETVTDCCYVNR